MVTIANVNDNEMNLFKVKILETPKFCVNEKLTIHLI